MNYTTFFIASNFIQSVVEWWLSGARSMNNLFYSPTFQRRLSVLRRFHIFAAEEKSYDELCKKGRTLRCALFAIVMAID